MSSSEIIVFLTVWFLLLCGIGFGLRARRKARRTLPGPRRS